MYQDFAGVYDRLMQDVDYVQWADYYMRLLQTHDAKAARIVECGCGTGSLTRHFAKWYHVTAIDCSEDMLQIACDKLADCPNVQLSLQDMRCFQSHGEQDAVLATCDAVNYLLNEDDVLNFFHSSYKALKTGGMLLFDISTPHKLFCVLPGVPWVDDAEDLSYIWHNEVEDSVLHMYLSIFCKDGDVYHRIDEEQTQTCFPKERYIAMLTQAGFGNIRIFGDQTLEPPAETEYRYHFTAIKMA